MIDNDIRIYPWMVQALKAGEVTPADLNFYILMRSEWPGQTSVVGTNTSLAEALGFSSQAVSKRLRELRHIGWIIQEREPGSHGAYRYHFSTWDDERTD